MRIRFQIGTQAASRRGEFAMFAFRFAATESSASSQTSASLPGLN